MGDFNNSLSPMDRSSRQEVNKNISELNNTIYQINIKDTYKNLYPVAKEYTFFF
jgi:hypothetical protein